MIGSKQRMPKSLRYPLFLFGLVVVLVGGIGAYDLGATPTSLAVVAVVGLLLMLASVAVK